MASTGRYSARQNKSNMWCMAVIKHRHLLCGYRALDWGGNVWYVDTEVSIAWFSTGVELTYWEVSWSVSVLSLWMCWYITQGMCICGLNVVLYCQCSFCQVGVVTCDSASNNSTMMAEFAKLVMEQTKVPYNPVSNQLKWVYWVCIVSILINC